MFNEHVENGNVALVEEPCINAEDFERQLSEECQSRKGGNQGYKEDLQSRYNSPKKAHTIIAGSVSSAAGLVEVPVTADIGPVEVGWQYANGLNQISSVLEVDRIEQTLSNESRLQEVQIDVVEGVGKGDVNNFAPNSILSPIIPRRDMHSPFTEGKNQTSRTCQEVGNKMGVTHLKHDSTSIRGIKLKSKALEAMATLEVGKQLGVKFIATKERVLDRLQELEEAEGV
ncbi:hypothetical protein V6N13_148758 [Hibiscus sabdariffa]|uniref:Uncharacterized protein n=1 Tax=Hibiscus sabdariffa TaxID=183260 RepID=A0ABR2EJE8_9ROSI